MRRVAVLGGVVGFDVLRADSLFNQQQILQDVVKGIADAEIVVADVTGLNGNVLYELGLAHALDKRTVMITQILDELPFDLRPYRANEYSTRFNSAHKLSQTLVDIAKAVLNGSADFSNPVQDFAPYALVGQAQVARRPQATGSAAAHSVDEDEAVDDEPGLLEYTVSIGPRTEEVVEAANEMATLTEDIGAHFRTHTERLERATARLGNRAPAAQLTIARDAARDLNSYADSLEPLSERLRAPLDEVAAAMNSVARHARLNDDDDLRSAEELAETLRGAEASMAGAREGIMTFAKTLTEMPHMERTLTAACRRAAQLVVASAELIETAESEFARARGLLQERVNSYTPS